MPAMTTNVLIAAMIMVESGGNPLAHNKPEQAVGILQIRPIMVLECNRILDLCQEDGLYTLFKMEDRWDTGNAVQMAEIYFQYHCKDQSAQKMARCWNGGPQGDLKECTLPYWKKVESWMNKFEGK